jgi:hypothetical protein
MGRYLDLLRHTMPVSSESINTYKKTGITDSSFSETLTKETNLTKEVPDLETRLHDHGIRIAIDKATGTALLVFADLEAEAVRDVATVHLPYEIQLTESQRQELTGSLDYYERVVNRKVKS